MSSRTQAFEEFIMAKKSTPSKLPAAAQRALKEADERRKKVDDALVDLPNEHKGRKGPEPTRYGDWEKNGIVSDF